MKWKYRVSFHEEDLTLKQKATTFFLAIGTGFIAFLLINFPEQSLQASIRGLNIWWEVVFPSLLPFFIIAELLIGFGVVAFIGILFEPIMRPLFNVPGVGSFAWIMGMASGYPSGAKISVRLREENQLTQIEAERLLSFTNASSPLFIFGAVSIGFFHDAHLGILIAVCHYLGNALVGIVMRFHGRSSTNQENNTERTQRPSIKHAFKKMHQTRINEKKPFGEIVGDAVINSITTLVMVGGFIILFSVLTQLLLLVGIMPIIAGLFEYGLHLLYLPIDLGLPLLTGLIEITIGAQMISELSINSMVGKAMIVSFILGFNGLSVQAQVASIIAKTDIRFTPYFISRILHGVIASLLTLILFKPLYINRKVTEVTDITGNNMLGSKYWTTILEGIKHIGPIVTLISLAIAVLILYNRSHKTK